MNVPRQSLMHKAHLITHTLPIGNDSARPSHQRSFNEGHKNAPARTALVPSSHQSTTEKDTLKRFLQRKQPPVPRSMKVSAKSTQKIHAIEDVPTMPERTGTGEMRSRIRFNVGVGWNSGIARRQEPNEDSLVVSQGTCIYNNHLVPFGLFVVADGMGGHDLGQEASYIAIRCMLQTVVHDISASTSLNDATIIELLVDAVEDANTAICQRCLKWDKDMGTTLTAALIVNTKAYVINVGDSRTYLYDDYTGLSQITLDHSLVAKLVTTGAITPEEVYTHPDRNKVYRSLGNRDGVEVDWFTYDLHKGDSLLLCSDGLWEMVRDPEIQRIIGSGQEPTRVCDMLVEAALRRGGADNVSVIVVRVE